MENDLRLHDTNKLWHEVSRIGTVTDLPPVDTEPDAATAVEQPR